MTRKPVTGHPYIELHSLDDIILSPDDPRLDKLEAALRKKETADIAKAAAKHAATLKANARKGDAEQKARQPKRVK